MPDFPRSTDDTERATRDSYVLHNRYTPVRIVCRNVVITAPQIVAPAHGNHHYIGSPAARSASAYDYASVAAIDFYAGEED